MCKLGRFLKITGIAICGAFLLLPKNVQAEPVRYQQEIFHRHTGDQNGGGCYSVSHTETREVEIPCEGTLHYWPELGTSQCSVCGASYVGNFDGRDCWHSTTETVTETFYTPGCGMDETTALGELYLEKSTGEWTKQLSLKGAYNLGQFLTLKSEPFIWNDGIATEQDEFQVEENGIYTLSLNVNGRENLSNPTIKAEVRNLDNTAPTMTYCILPMENFSREGVTVSVLSAEDKQPDGSLGCGLHTAPFSFDGGANWTEEDNFIFQENGDYELAVRDQLENFATYPVHITQIDKTGPVIKRTDVKKVENSDEYMITVEAEDLQEDGSAGAGLPADAYSFDGGSSWSGDTFHQFAQNTDVVIEVRDILGNISQRKIKTPLDSMEEDGEEQDYPEPEQPAVPVEEQESPEPEQPEEIQEPVKETAVKDIETGKNEEAGIENNTNIQQVIPKPKVTVYGKKAMETEPLENDPAAEEDDSYEAGVNMILFWKLLLIITGIICILIFMLFWYSAVFIYNENDNRYRLAGIAFVKKKDKVYFIPVRNGIVEKCVTTKFLFRVSVLFYFFHKNDTVNYIFPDQKTVIQEIKRKEYINLI